MVDVPVLVGLDRDSVAMGDDMSSRACRLSFPDGTRLADLLETTHPDIENRGWSWVAVVDGTVSAVWSVDHGVCLLVRNRRLRGSASPIPVVFRYFLQLDPQWLHGRLAAGAAANRDALSVEYAPLAAERLETEQRRREREVPEKLLSAAAVGALARLGATIDLHSDARCRFLAAGERWVVVRSDSMTVVYRGETPAPIASLRPRAFAELWLATAVGGAWTAGARPSSVAAIRVDGGSAAGDHGVLAPRHLAMVVQRRGRSRRSALRRGRPGLVPLRVRAHARRDRGVTRGLRDQAS